jgi:hypothetical protein
MTQPQSTGSTGPVRSELTSAGSKVTSERPVSADCVEKRRFEVVAKVGPEVRTRRAAPQVAATGAGSGINIASLRRF